MEKELEKKMKVSLINSSSGNETGLTQKNTGQFYFSSSGVQSINVGFVPKIFIYRHASNSYTDSPNMFVFFDENAGSKTIYGAMSGISAEVLKNQNPTESNRLAFFDDGTVKIYSSSGNRYATWTAYR